MPLVTLLTDFGTADYFVAAMKGVILGRDAGIAVVDVTHDIPPQDVHAAAFTLLAAYPAFPQGTVHVAVVDPGVGSPRRAVLVEASGHLFVGPDNGLFGWLCERHARARVFHVTRDSLFRHPVSATFHGRDVFAPVAAALATGLEPEEVGPEVHDAVRLEPLTPERLEDGRLRGSVIHVDRFGNCVTSFTHAELPEDLAGSGLLLEVGGREIRSVRRFYAEEDEEPGEVFAIWGSAGFLELSINRASAADTLGVRRGAAVTASLG